jgi:hypothetical protein
MVFLYFRLADLPLADTLITADSDAQYFQLCLWNEHSITRSR